MNPDAQCCLRLENSNTKGTKGTKEFPLCYFEPACPFDVSLERTDGARGGVVFEVLVFFLTRDPWQLTPP